MKTFRIRTVLVILVALALTLPLGSLGDAQTTKGTIKIATQSPLSGGQAALGEGIKLGAQLAVEKFKGGLEKRGFKVELVPFDDQAKPDVGVANAKNIIADKDIAVVIGHLNSGVAIPSSEVYKEVNLAMVSPATTRRRTGRASPSSSRRTPRRRASRSSASRAPKRSRTSIRSSRRSGRRTPTSSTSGGSTSRR